MKHSFEPKLNLPVAPVWIIGSYGNDGKANLMAASWVGIVSTKPPALSVSIKYSAQTYENITLQNAFTVGIPSCEQHSLCDTVGNLSGHNADKFELLQIEPKPAQKVYAPYADIIPLWYELNLLNILRFTSHANFIGEIVNVLIDDKPFEPLIADPSNRSYYKRGDFIAKINRQA
jgi:flavin reductase (DIM6/NTAB) family NADH-FMN oxidoreductase RutF